MFCNRPHPRFPFGAKALHILHTLSVPSASTSCVFSKAHWSPASLSNFSAVGGARSGAVRRRNSIGSSFRLHRRRFDTYLSLFTSYPGKCRSTPRTSLPQLSGVKNLPDTGIESLKVIAFGNVGVKRYEQYCTRTINCARLSKSALQKVILTLNTHPDRARQETDFK
jgi:hypothetical protein